MNEKKIFYSQTLKNTNLKNVTIQLKLNSREKKPYRQSKWSNQFFQNYKIVNVETNRIQVKKTSLIFNSNAAIVIPIPLRICKSSNKNYRNIIRTC